MFLQDVFSIVPWQNLMHRTPSARQPYRRVSNLPEHLHTVSRLGGKGFRHGRSVLKSKCSFHTCSIGSSLVSGSLAVASRCQALCTRKVLHWSQQLDLTFSANAVSCSVKVFASPKFVRYCTWSEAIALCLAPTWPMQSSPVSKAYVP